MCNVQVISATTRHSTCTKKGRASLLVEQNELSRTHSQSTRTHSCKQHRQPRTQPSHHLIPASCRSPASRHSRCSAQARASGLEGAERAKPHSRSTRNTPRNLAASRGRRRRGSDERRRTLLACLQTGRCTRPLLAFYLGTLTYGRSPPGPVVNSVLRTSDGLVIVRPKAMSRPRKAAGLLKSPDCHPSSLRPAAQTVPKK